mmetsp:Transcript_21951/g.47584  ORF Transcript_21951/g.47584 Transcript_21951/m.47584 type:complete len:278 (-) Transcript_21951:932-1765(-)
MQRTDHSVYMPLCNVPHKLLYCQKERKANDNRPKATPPHSTCTRLFANLLNPGTLNRPNTLATLILINLQTLTVFGRPNPPNALEWKLIMHFSYCTFLNTLVAASHPHFSASARARTPISVRNSVSIIVLAQFKYPSVSPGWTKNPVSLSRIKSGIPPAAHPITGTPLAMDSNTTNPNVSESLGIMNTSALANAELNSSPLNCPVNTVLVSLKYSFNSSSCGPFPTIHNLALGICSKTGRISFNLFSPPNLPTYTIKKSPSFPSVIFLLISSLLYFG